MKKFKLLIFIASIFLLIGIGFNSYEGFANGSGNGGQISTKGKITFYEESSEPIVESSEEPPIADSSLPPTGGKLPNTGETVKNNDFIGGGLILVTGIIFLYAKRKKEGESHEN